MKNLIEFILKNITTKPDSVVVEEIQEDGAIHFTVSVDPEDVGRVIGKEGKIIKAIRSIMRVAAIQKGQRVRVSVLSDEVGTTQSDDEIVVETSAEESSAEEVMSSDKEEESSTEPTPSTPEEDSQDPLTIEVPEV